MKQEVTVDTKKGPEKKIMSGLIWLIDQNGVPDYKKDSNMTRERALKILNMSEEELTG